MFAIKVDFDSTDNAFFALPKNARHVLPCLSSARCRLAVSD